MHRFRYILPFPSRRSGYDETNLLSSWIVIFVPFFRFDFLDSFGVCTPGVLRTGVLCTPSIYVPVRAVRTNSIVSFFGGSQQNQILDSSNDVFFWGFPFKQSITVIFFPENPTKTWESISFLHLIYRLRTKVCKPFC
jgi:hypothetical protein